MQEGFCWYSLCGNFGGLSLTSVSVMVTLVVPERPPMCPPMSLACITTWYSSLASLSMLGRAVLMIPAGTREGGAHRFNENPAAALAIHQTQQYLQWWWSSASPEHRCEESSPIFHTQHRPGELQLSTETAFQSSQHTEHTEIAATFWCSSSSKCQETSLQQSRKLCSHTSAAASSQYIQLTLMRSGHEVPLKETV